MRMQPLHTKTETNRQEQQTGEEKDPDSYSLRVSHCKSQLAVFPPSRCPSLQSCVDIRPVQKGSAQLIAGPLRVGGGGGVEGQDMGGWRWGLSVCLHARACEQRLRNREADTAPSDMEVRGQAEQDDQSGTTAAPARPRHPCRNNHK